MPRDPISAMATEEPSLELAGEYVVLGDLLVLRVPTSSAVPIPLALTAPADARLLGWSLLPMTAEHPPTWLLLVLSSRVPASTLRWRVETTLGPVALTCTPARREAVLSPEDEARLVRALLLAAEAENVDAVRSGLGALANSIDRALARAVGLEARVGQDGVVEITGDLPGLPQFVLLRDQADLRLLPALDLSLSEIGPSRARLRLSLGTAGPAQPIALIGDLWLARLTSTRNG